MYGTFECMLWKIKMNFLKSKKDETKSIERDVGLAEDTFSLCANLTAMESHFLGNFMATEDENYLNELSSTRKLRTHYLNLIAKCDIAQTWCISKHLCMIYMNLQELCTRFLSIKDMENAKKCAIDARETYLKFLKINGYKEEDLDVKSSA